MTKRDFQFIERVDLLPICPHCDQELREVHRKSKGAGFIVGRNNVFFCPHCRKVLGFGQSRLG